MKNLQCKVCKRYCHPKCAKTAPPITLKKFGVHRYKIVRSRNWECEACILNVLPFYDISNSQIKSLIPKFILPTPGLLNDKFVNEKNDSDKEDLDFTYFTHKTEYAYSKDIVKLNFDDEQF